MKESRCFVSAASNELINLVLCWCEGQLSDSLVSGWIPTAFRGLFGRKNLARLLDIFEAIFVAVAISWLFVVFPFDFAHLADVLPSFLRFLLQWISNDIAKVLMVLGIIVTLVMAIYNAIFYVLVRREHSKPTLKTA